MRFLKVASIAAALVITACSDIAPLPDTLMFPPGLSIHYQGKPAKLYGTSQCAQGQLSGHTCLIFPPENPQSSAVIISGPQIFELKLFAKRDPENPAQYVVVDAKDRRILSTNGRHDEYGNIEIAPLMVE